MHGGKTPMGPGLRQFRHGRRSKFLPSRMAADYHACVDDPALTELRQDIATIDARIIDVLKRVDTGEAGVVWRKAQAAMAKFEREQAQGHVEAMEVVLGQVRHLIMRGASDHAAWDEVGNLIDRRRKLVDSEQRRIALASETLSAEQAMILLTVIVGIIQRHVTDREVLRAIASDFQVLGVTRPSRGDARLCPTASTAEG